MSLWLAEPVVVARWVWLVLVAVAAFGVGQLAYSVVELVRTP